MLVSLAYEILNRQGIDLCVTVLSLNCNIQLDHCISECNFELEDEDAEFLTRYWSEAGLVHGLMRFDRVLNYLNVIKQVIKLLNRGQNLILKTLSLTKFRDNFEI